MSVSNRCSVVLFAFAASCATSTPPGGAPGSAADGAQATRNANVISAEELHDTPILQVNALRAIQLLRPMFLRSIGPVSGSDAGAGKVQISFDFGLLQPVAELSSYNTLNLVEVRYLDANEAQLRFGLRANSGPVILLLTHR